MNILIVDDNQTNLDLLEAVLEAEGHHVHTAGDGLEALAVLDKEPVDVIISDILMPRMDGYRLCFEVRRSKRFHNVPFIVYTNGYSSASEDKTALELGADKFVRKPASSSMILEALSDVMQSPRRSYPHPIDPPEELALLKEYSERLLENLQEKNAKLRQQAEVLRITYHQLRHLMAHSPAVLYTLKIESGKITPIAVSDSIQRFLGVSGSDPISYECWANCLHPADRANVLEQSGQGLAAEGYCLEYRVRHQNGSYRWVEDKNYVVPGEAGQAAQAVGVWTDITERKRSEQSLKAQLAAAHLLADTANPASAMPKLLGAICEHLGWDVGAVWMTQSGSLTLRCQEIWHPPSTEFLEFKAISLKLQLEHGGQLAGTVLASGKPLWILDLDQYPAFERKTAAGKLGLRSSVMLPFVFRERVTGVLEFFSRETREPDDAMLEVLGGLGSQISQAYDRAQLQEQFRHAQKMEAVGQLASGIAHDFNNILTLIQGHSGLMQMESNLAPSMRESLKQISDAAQRAGNLTTQLLLFSRNEILKPQPLDLNLLVKRAAQFLGRIIGEHILLTCDLAREPLSIQADRAMLEQVLFNLAVNARDAMPKGGKLTLQTRGHLPKPGDSRHNGDLPHCFVALRVIDTGCGISAENLTRIFEPFFTTKAAGRGTGLGLAAVRGIVQQHGGRINVTSTPGQGTVFEVFIPRLTEPAPVSRPSLDDPRPAHSPSAILLVEDETAVRQLAATILKRHGYTVLEAACGTEASTVWEQNQHHIGLLMTDLVMPNGMSGRELARKLLAQNSALKVIYSSGYNPEGADTAFLPREGTDYLRKPYEPMQLLEIVRQAFNGVPHPP